MVYLIITSFLYSCIPFCVLSCTGICFHFCLVRHILWQVAKLATGNLLYRFYAFTLLLFYAFKTLCFYSKPLVCKPDFLLCLDTFFTTCTKIIRQIKQLICPLIAVWQCLAFKGSVWHCYTVQCFRKQGFTLYNDFY